MKQLFLSPIVQTIQAAHHAVLAETAGLRRQARLGVFFYSLALHALVLFTLLRWGHASHGHASVGEAELQLLCQRARVVGSLGL